MKDASNPLAGTAGPGFALHIPGPGTLGRLFLGGFAGLMAWEVWARFITAAILGGPLQPAGLVVSLGQALFGIEIPFFAAEVIHYVIGIVGYPILYFIVSRHLKNWAKILDVGVWLLFTAYAVRALATGQITATIGGFWLIVTLVTFGNWFTPNKLLADCLSWGSYTWFNALGIMAPLAGLPFLLLDGAPLLSFMSWVGHILFGATAAYVFERLEAKAAP